MKKLLLLAVAFVAGFTVMAQSADQFIKVSEKHDFGKIKQGVPVTTYLEIKNISDKPVVIENAWAGCGCTTPEVTKEPIAAGASTKIKIGYNAAAMGHFDKMVNVKLAGVQDPKLITITGEVLDAAAYDAFAKAEEAKKSTSKTSTNAKSTKTKKTNK
ncbi:MAG TPA: DUF1573 domain-containing protein [Flavisolibacter sp.]|nr:DUF1573 domain-containing protein [Flavisolibacter sp.]